MLYLFFQEEKNPVSIFNKIENDIINKKFKQKLPYYLDYVSS